MFKRFPSVTHVIFIKALQGRFDYSPHITDQDTEKLKSTRQGKRESQGLNPGHVVLDLTPLSH